MTPGPSHTYGDGPSVIRLLFLEWPFLSSFVTISALPLSLSPRPLVIIFNISTALVEVSILLAIHVLKVSVVGGD